VSLHVVVIVLLRCNAAASRSFTFVVVVFVQRFVFNSTRATTRDTRRPARAG
jgi:FPC/CPF motif-containing protein YcgG